jgi:hypothetical protein
MIYYSRRFSQRPFFVPTLPIFAMKIILFFIFFMWHTLLIASEKEFVVRYPRYSTNDDPREKFPLAVLELAFAKAKVKATFQQHPLVMEVSRATLELEQGKNINLIWTTMEPKFEKDFRPILIPLYRGLYGQRIFLINKRREADFAKVKTLEDLRQFKAGIGFGWGIGDLMEEAKLPFTRMKYDGLFKLLDLGGIDYIPRGATVVFSEWRNHRVDAPNLMVEPHLVLSYRNDFIFYTHKKDEAMARVIEAGLHKAYADGSFMKLFNEHPAIVELVKEVALEKRLRLLLPDDNLSKENLAIPERYWANKAGR